MPRSDHLARRAAELRAQRPTDDRVVVVLGPPCSGKTTYVAEHATPGDVVVDFDELAIALGSPRPHDHLEPFLSVAHAARDAVVERFRRERRHGARMWLIATSRSQLGQWGVAGCRRVVLDTPIDECVRRARAADRTEQAIQVIRDWTG